MGGWCADNRGDLANPMVAVHIAPQLRQGDLPSANDLIGDPLGLNDSHARFRGVEDAQII